MNEMQVFESKEFGSIRTIMQDGEPWFVAVDVCRALEIANVPDAVARLDEDEKNTIALTDSIPGNPNRVVINEPARQAGRVCRRSSRQKAAKPSGC